MFKKQKYIVWFVKKEQEIYSILDKKRIFAFSKKVRYKKGVYFIDTSNPTFKKPLRLFFLIDIDKSDNCQLHIIKNKKNSGITPKDIDLFIEQEIVGQLTTNLSDTTMKMNIMLVILGLAFGGLVGWIVGGL